MSNLLKISHCDDSQRQADVIFIHGLDGDARDTWQHKNQPDTFWPAWLGEDHPELGIWSLDYEARALAWQGHSMPLVDRASQVLDLLDLEGIGQRPLAFVCHSLGGLLAKQILHAAPDQERWHKRFVRLTLLLDQGEQAQGQRWRESRGFQHLAEILDATAEQGLVLLGPPGSGKSTLLRHFELDNAHAMLQRTEADLSHTPLTLFASLNDFRGNPLPQPLDWLNECWNEFKAVCPDLPELSTALRQSRVTLLLDALNEIPATQSEAIGIWRDFLRELNRNYPGNRVVFSCRSLDYSASLSSSDHPVPQIRIESLDKRGDFASGQSLARVLRGGSWSFGGQDARTGNRNDFRVGIRYGTAGFRLCRTSPILKH